MSSSRAQRADLVEESSSYVEEFQQYISNA